MCEIVRVRSPGVCWRSKIEDLNCAVCRTRCEDVRLMWGEYGLVYTGMVGLKGGYGSEALRRPLLDD
jgi:hypothetical protein